MLDTRRAPDASQSDQAAAATVLHLREYDMCRWCLAILAFKTWNIDYVLRCSSNYIPLSEMWKQATDQQLRPASKSGIVLFCA